MPLVAMRRVHVAIMRRSWGLLEKILSGEKTIESRWYMQKSEPWESIDAGDIIYFKNSGAPVTLSASVDKVLQFERLNPKKVREILERFGAKDGLDVGEIERYFYYFKHKHYCILIFLKDIQKVEPFDIDKTGFGARAAWITVDDIDKIKKIKESSFRQRTLLKKTKQVNFQISN